ncbi:hypothetical protein Cgig2_005765 [Carnegiea gigantea]|uniref:Transmembrane protein n=1 Tax=Carnegiea gigantea TaxID=171969 RepID=A0A9Q1GVZ8_9CARY|nr:hypothetical protein Cgig2_005765 [Carnegiea gigantea]
MLNFDYVECKIEAFEIILPASVSSRDLRCIVTLQFKTDTIMVIAQAQTQSAAVAFFRTQSLDRLTSFCLLRLLVVCGDISFSSIYLWFIGRLILLVVRMYWGVAMPSWFDWDSSPSDNENLYSCSIMACRFLVLYLRFAFLSLASVYYFGLSMICCWF